MLPRKIATEPRDGTVTVAMPFRSTVTLVPEQLPLLKLALLRMSQYTPRGSPVLIQPLLPRLKAIRFARSSHQFAIGAAPTKLCQLTMLATAWSRSMQIQVGLAPEQSVFVICPSGVDGGDWLVSAPNAKPAYTCGVP